MRASAVILTIAAAVAAQSADTVSATGAGCEPHDDHWHCPAGVAEPTFAPSAASAITSAASAATTLAPSASASHSHDNEDDHSHAVTAATCEPHDDHWHCPSGVAEPTTAPAQTRTTSRASSASAASASRSASASASQLAGAGSAVGANPQGVVAVLLGAVGAFFL